MKLSPVNNNIKNKNFYNTNFKANERWVYDKNSNPLYKTTTSLLRKDLDWGAYICMLCAKYSFADKVNVLIHACSNGMEAYSFLLSLMHLKPEFVDKFTPIIAKDIDSENIYAAKQNGFKVTKGDISRINYLTDFQLNKYFDLNLDKEDIYLQPKTELKEKIIFSQGDIFDDVKNMPEKNNILHARNFWKYLSKIRQELLMHEISERMVDDTSILALGDYDINVKIDSLLRHYNFVENLNVSNVYSKQNNFGKYARYLY